MIRTIQEILAELEANRDEARAQRKAAAEKMTAAEAAIREAIEAQEAALKEGNQAAYDQATQDRAFHEEVKKRIETLPLYYTPEQMNEYKREADAAQIITARKFAKQIAPLIDQIQQLEKEAMEEIHTSNHVSRLVKEALSDDISADWPLLPTDCRLAVPTIFTIDFPRIPYECYHRIFVLAGRQHHH